MINRRVFLLLALLVGTARAADAATVHLTDGTHIEGTVVSATAREIQVSTGDGIRKIDAAQILRIDYAEQPAPQQPTVEAPPAPREQRNTTLTAREWTRPEINAKQQFSFNFGIAAPMTEVDLGAAGGGKTDNGNAGLLLGAEYLHALSPRWASGIGFGYFNRSQNASTGLVPQIDTSVGGDTVLIQSLLKYSFVKAGSVRPYLLAGLGINRTSTEIDAKPQFGWEWDDTATDETRRWVDDSNWGLASSLRLGLDFMATEPTFFSFELGWTQLSNNRYDATVQGRDFGLNTVSGDIGAFTVAGRWGWRFQ